MKKKIYVGCSLTGAPESFKKEIKELIKFLNEEEYEVLRFYSFVYGDASSKDAPDVYSYDVARLQECDVMVAVCTYPSTGLGYEISYALNLGKPVIAIAHHNDNISRLVEGIDHEKFTFQRVKKLSDAKTLLDKLSV